MKQFLQQALTNSVVFILVALLTIFFQISEQEQTNRSSQPDITGIEHRAGSKLYLVNRVIDGDTIELKNKAKVRYIGIDAPETKDPSSPVECYGQEAYRKNKELVEGRVVSLEFDVNQTDRYGRWLRYVYVDDVMINELLVRQGYALASPYPPDIKYQEQFEQAEQEARENERGLWGDVCQL